VRPLAVGNWRRCVASSWTHAAAAVVVAATVMPRGVPSRTWLVVAVAAAVPDLDGVGRIWGAGDVQWLGGHRAFTHSVVFAAAFGALLGLTVWRALTKGPARALACLAFAFAVASHGTLDSLTTYGEGVQFLAPFTTARYWAPWRLLGDGILRDTIAFVVFCILARWLITRRGAAPPRVFDPRVYRATG
jgi:inner membrane protein